MILIKSSARRCCVFSNDGPSDRHPSSSWSWPTPDRDRHQQSASGKAPSASNPHVFPLDRSLPHSAAHRSPDGSGSERGRFVGLKGCNFELLAGPVNAGPKLAKELPHRRKKGKVRCHFSASVSRISTQDCLINNVGGITSRWWMNTAVWSDAPFDWIQSPRRPNSQHAATVIPLLSRSGWVIRRTTATGFLDRSL